MSYNNTFYLHFVTDLRRVVTCISNKNVEGAQSFFDHAHKIYEEKLKQIMDGESKELRIDDLWLSLYTNSLPSSKLDQEKLSEKLLTLSSMIFLRSTEHMAVLPHDSKIAEQTHAVVTIES
jgi:flagellin-specific chaperone FliS